MPRLSKARKELLTTMMKQSIFEAATSVLCEHGMNGTTMNRVAEAADLAKSSLYDYFPSEDKLMEFVSDRLEAPFMRAVEETLRADLPAPQKLDRILGGSPFETGTKHKAIIRLVVYSGQRDKAQQRARPRMLEVFTAIFAAGDQRKARSSRIIRRALAGCSWELSTSYLSCSQAAHPRRRPASTCVR